MRQGMEEIFSALKVDFAENLEGVKPSIVSGGGNRLVEHVSVPGLPHFGGGAHASIGNGQVHVAAVVGTKVLREPGSLVCGGVSAQTYRCCQIIEQVLHVCQTEWADLLRLTVHMPQLEDGALEAFEAAAGFFSQERGCPSVAVSVVGCSQLLLAAAVQIEGTAVHKPGPMDGSKSWPCPPSPAVGAPSAPSVSSTVASAPVSVSGRWRSISTEQVAGGPRSGSPRAAVAPPDRPVFSQGAPTDRHHQRSRPPPRGRLGVSEAGRPLQEEDHNSARHEERASPQRALALQDDSAQLRERSPALRWLSQQREASQDSALGWLLQESQEADEKSAPLALPSSSSTAAFARNTAQDQGVVSCSDVDEISGRGAVEGSCSETVLEEVETKRRVRRTWVQKHRTEAAGATLAAAADAVGASYILHRSQSAGSTARARTGSPLTGHEPSLSLLEMGVAQARQLGLRFQGEHNLLWRVRMEAAQTCRTVRLGPGELLCKHLAGCRRVWSYTFDVVLATTANSLVNIGLVEWVATPKEGMLGTDIANGLMGISDVTLADLLGVEASEVPGTAHSSLNESERPRQMMLACRKGSRWYGNSVVEPVFNDDFCAGSLLHFRCDYTFSAEGSPIQVRLWLLPSPVCFRRQGRQVAQLQGPLFEYQLPQPASGDKAAPAVWVPAVTLFTQQDTVLLSWRGDNRPPGTATTPLSLTNLLSPPLASEAVGKLGQPLSGRSPRSSREEQPPRRMSSQSIGRRPQWTTP